MDRGGGNSFSIEQTPASQLPTPDWINQRLIEIVTHLLSIYQSKDVRQTVSAACTVPTAVCLFSECSSLDE